jgi:CheY-like chemotaxis protein
VQTLRFNEADRFSGGGGFSPSWKQAGAYVDAVNGDLFVVGHRCLQVSDWLGRPSGPRSFVVEREVEFSWEIIMVDTHRNILVVEDSAVLAKILGRTLRDAGFTVTFATNGREAWEATQSTQFDLIVTDHQMPEMSGGELCEKLRQTEDYAETPIIMISSKSFELDLPRLQESLQLSAVFAKPFSTTKVLRVVEDCVGRLTL